MTPPAAIVCFILVSNNILIYIYIYVIAALNHSHPMFDAFLPSSIYPVIVNMAMEIHPFKYSCFSHLPI